MKTICLDFDGVLSDYHGWKGEEVLDPPRPGVEDFLKTLVDMGYKLAIHTTRSALLISQWLKEYGLDQYVSEITHNKPPAVCYIDDRAIRFDGDYGECLTQISGFKAYWE